MKKKFRLSNLKRNWQLTAMISPAVISYIIFAYIPMVGLVLTFENYQYDKGLFSLLVGIYNFKFLFLLGDAFNITKNNILFNVVFIIVGLVLQLTCAILLSEIAGEWFKKITQSLMFMPYFVSWVVGGAVVYNTFNFEHGAVNTFLRSVGGIPLDIYNNASLS